GRSADDSAFSRTTASPPGAQPSADVRIENVRRYGDTVPASDTSSMAADAPTARRRSRSTSSRTSDAPMTRAGSAASVTSQRRASFILILARLGRHDAWHRQDGAAQPRIEPHQDARESHERFDHNALEHAVLESTLEREQKQIATQPIRHQDSEMNPCPRWPIAHRVFHAVQIV